MDTILAITKQLKRSVSTVSREIKHNLGRRNYNYKQSDKLAKQRQNATHGDVKIKDVSNELARYALNIAGANIIFLVEQSGVE